MNKLESLHSNFFLGADIDEKMSWFSWEKVIAPKKSRVWGLVVFSLLIELFCSNGFGVLRLSNVLWVHVTKVIHGAHGFLDREPSGHRAMCGYTLL